MPVLLTSIFLKREVEKNDGSLQTSFVIALNSAITEGELVSIEEMRHKLLRYLTMDLQSIQVSIINLIDPE